MGNKLIGQLLLITLLTTQSRGADFVSKGCPGENLEKTCAALAAIPTDKVMVFADGTEMPACYLQTANPELTNESKEKEKELYRIVFLRLERTLGPALMKNVQDSMFEPAEIMQFVAGDPEARTALEEIIQIQSKVRPPRRGVAKNYSAEFNFIKKEMANVIDKGKFQSSSGKEQTLYKVSAIQKVDREAVHPITCRPMIQAFYAPTVDKTEQFISVSPAVTNFPTFEKLRIIGHEMAHSIDPCKDDFSGNYPYQKLVDCLQQDVGHFKKGLFNYSKDMHTCEAFADAVGVYIAEKWQKQQPPLKPIVKDSSPNKIYMPPGFEMIIFDLDTSCREMIDQKPTTTHPSSIKRFQDIILKNPTVAKAVNCPMDAKTPRCDIETGFKGYIPGLYDKIVEKFKSFR